MKLSHSSRTLLAFIHDVVAAAVAWCVAFWLRFNLDIPLLFSDVMWRWLPLVVIVYSLVFYRFGLYRGIWRYASLLDLKQIVIAVGSATLPLAVLLLMLQLTIPVPRSVLVLQPILLIAIMSGSRISYRIWKEHRLYGLLRNQGEPVLVVGVGDVGAGLVKELTKSEEWRIVGLVDDDTSKHGRFLNGAKVLGPIADIHRLAQESGATHAIIAMPSATRAVRRQVLEVCVNAGLKVLTVPSFKDLMSGRVAISQIRKVEVEDLLGRDAVVLDDVGLNEFLTGKVIMVTGAGGSIGSELCRQIAAFNPSLLVFFELNEFALYSLQEEFAASFPRVSVVGIVGDVKNEFRLGSVVRKYAPSTIFHAAAYKHVPMMEEINSWEAVRNNVLGTYVAASVASANRVKKFVLISTDKAVNPTNVMGGSKRLAEIVCQAMQRTSTTGFEMVRFGNVLGSTGSVIPKFHEQIAKGGPVTVTHPDIIRYFMSIPEAAQLVLQAGCMGRGGEVFVMDMGEPIKIADLAREMIRLAGFSDEEIRIVYTGLRPGEKLFEELLADNEETRPSDHPKLRVARASYVESFDLEKLIGWLQQPRDLDDDEVRRDLKRWVPEYTTAMKAKLRVV